MGIGVKYFVGNGKRDSGEKSGRAGVTVLYWGYYFVGDKFTSVPFS